MTFEEHPLFYVLEWVALGLLIWGVCVLVMGFQDYRREGKKQPLRGYLKRGGWILLWWAVLRALTILGTARSAISN